MNNTEATERDLVTERAREWLRRPMQNDLFVQEGRPIIEALCDEVERLRAREDRASTCAVCEATLLTSNEPPHCIDCYVTEEDRERWEAQA